MWQGSLRFPRAPASTGNAAIYGSNLGEYRAAALFAQKGRRLLQESDSQVGLSNFTWNTILSFSASRKKC
jgi:hypothetical protein